MVADRRVELRSFPFIASISEIKFEGGVASASSFSDEEMAPSKAFEARGKGWLSDDESYPEWRFHPKFLWYEFQDEKIPHEISFQCAQTYHNTCMIRRMPMHFSFIGSNEKVCSAASIWENLCSVRNNTPITSIDDVRGCEVQKNYLGKGFRCLGLKITEKLAPRAAVARVRMWEL